MEDCLGPLAGGGQPDQRMRLVYRDSGCVWFIAIPRLAFTRLALAAPLLFDRRREMGDQWHR